MGAARIDARTTIAPADSFDRRMRLFAGGTRAYDRRTDTRVPAGHRDPRTRTDDGAACARPRRAGRNPDDDVLHVRMPLRHPRASARRRSPLHRRQPRASAEPGRDLREGLVGDHEAVFARAAHAAADAQAGRGARRRAVRAGVVGGRVRRARKAPRAPARDRSEALRAVYRPRPDAGAHRAVREAVRHAELRGARRLLLGEHGGRDDLHDRRLVLGNSAAPISIARSCSS